MKRTLLAMMIATALGGATCAADLGGQNYSPRTASDSCAYWGQSVLASTYSTIPELMAEVRQRYEHAMAVSEAHSTAYSNKERYTWSYAARGACGRAIGYLSTGEIIPERLWDCECYYDRMGNYISTLG
jgi:hypothetical protein